MGIVQETEIWPYYQMVYAHTKIHTRKWGEQNSLKLWDTNGSLSPTQKTNRQKIISEWKWKKAKRSKKFCWTTEKSCGPWDFVDHSFIKIGISVEYWRPAKIYCQSNLSERLTVKIGIKEKGKSNNNFPLFNLKFEFKELFSLRSVKNPCLKFRTNAINKPEYKWNYIILKSSITCKSLFYINIILVELW